jgi:hypothetical protein
MEIVSLNIVKHVVQNYGEILVLFKVNKYYGFVHAYVVQVWKIHSHHNTQLVEFVSVEET